MKTLINRPVMVSLLTLPTVPLLQAQEWPAAIKAVEARGTAIVERFDAHKCSVPPNYRRGGPQLRWPLYNHLCLPTPVTYVSRLNTRRTLRKQALTLKRL